MGYALVECDLEGRCIHAAGIYFPPEPSMADEEDGWDKIGPHVLIELKRLNHTMRELSDEIQQIHKDEITPIKIEIAQLKIKAGVWGLMGGAIPALIIILLKYLQESP